MFNKMPITQHKMNNILANQNSIDYAINGWLRYGTRYFTPRTIQQYEMVIRRYFQLSSGVATEDIENYLDRILEENTAATGNAHLTAIKSFCRWTARKFECSNPAKVIDKFTENPPRQRVLSGQEYKTVLKITTGLETDTIQFLGNTGLRKSEFQSLTWQNISPDMSHLLIVGKGRKQRIIPLNLICKQILQKTSPQLPFVQKYQGHNLYCLCCRLAKQTNIPRFGPHALRHFFATRLIRAGVPLIKVSQILGHSSIITTERIYVHLVPRDLLGVTDCLDL